MTKGEKIDNLYAAIGTNIEGKEIIALGRDGIYDKNPKPVIYPNGSIVKSIVDDMKEIAASQGIDLRVVKYKRVTDELSEENITKELINLDNIYDKHKMIHENIFSNNSGEEAITILRLLKSNPMLEYNEKSNNLVCSKCKENA